METAFISGHIDLSQKEFTSYYKDKIDESIELEHNFVMGNASVCDTMAHSYLKLKGVDDDRITVGKRADFPSCNKRDTYLTLISTYDIAYVRSPEEVKKRLGDKYNPKRISSTQQNLNRRKKLKII